MSDGATIGVNRAWYDRLLAGLAMAIQLLALIVCFVGLGCPVAELVDSSPPLTLFATIAILVFSYFILIAVHEAGHALLGAVAGWRIVAASALWLTVWPRPFRLHWGHAARSGFAGAVYPVPPDGPPSRLLYIIPMTGGVLANAVLSALLDAAATAFAVDSFMGRWLAVIAILSGASALTNLFPYVTKSGATTDGRKIVDALRGKDLSVYYAEVRLSTEIVRRKNPGEWDPQIVAAVERYATAGTSTWYGDYLPYVLAMHRGEFDAAKALLERAIAKAGPRPTLMLERVYFCAYASNDVAAARTLLDELSARPIRHLPGYWPALAVVLSREGKLHDAGKAVAQARKRLRGSPFATKADFDALDRLERLGQPA